MAFFEKIMALWDIWNYADFENENEKQITSLTSIDKLGISHNANFLTIFQKVQECHNLYQVIRRKDSKQQSKTRKSVPENLRNALIGALDIETIYKQSFTLQAREPYNMTDAKYICCISRI